MLCFATGRLDRMSHRKWRETKQQPSSSRSGHQISCCSLSYHFLWDILSSRPVLVLREDTLTYNFGTEFLLRSKSSSSTRAGLCDWYPKSANLWTYYELGARTSSDLRVKVIQVLLQRWKKKSSSFDTVDNCKTICQLTSSSCSANVMAWNICTGLHSAERGHVWKVPEHEQKSNYKEAYFMLCHELNLRCREEMLWYSNSFKILAFA